MICISFDTDHMDEARMQEFLEAVEIPGTATFFCTQDYPCLSATGHELGPHPFLGEAQAWGAELEQKRQMLPEAQGWRSHSCVFSHMLAEQVASMGYRWVSTHDDFGRADVRPHRHCWGVWQMPIFYMDNLDFSQSRFWAGMEHKPFSRQIIDTAVSGAGVYVFDFHPIHLLMNCGSADWYFKQRDPFLNGAPLEHIRSPQPGVHDFFVELCETMKREGIRSMGMTEALDGYCDEHAREQEGKLRGD
ncbi:MAG: hypothetical protein KDK91_00510 [Gammaproteobacteria bacterium]|nr:hypothetical protein [Gammaproteobacteria bacterium]